MDRRIALLALRLVLSAVIGAALGAIPGILVGMPFLPLCVIGGGAASLLLVPQIKGWNWKRRGVAVGMLAPAVGFAFTALGLAIGDPASLIALILAPAWAVVMWPVWLLTIPLGIAAALVYDQLAPLISSDNRALEPKT